MDDLTNVVIGGEVYLVDYEVAIAILKSNYEKQLLKRKYAAAIALVWEAYDNAGFPVIDPTDVKKIEEMK